MTQELQWDDEAARYVASRSLRYPGGLDLRPEWCRDVLADPDLAAFEPDPTSRIGASRFIGWSTGAERLLVVIAYHDLDDDLHVINAWPASGADVAQYARTDPDSEEED